MRWFKLKRERWCLVSAHNVHGDPTLSFTNIQRGFTDSDGLHMVMLDLRAEGYEVCVLETGHMLRTSYLTSDAPTVETVLADAGWRGWVQYGRNVPTLLSKECPVTGEAGKPSVFEPEWKCIYDEPI